MKAVYITEHGGADALTYGDLRSLKLGQTMSRCGCEHAR